MATTHVGSAVIGWGTKDETWGVYENISVKYSAEKEEHKNGIGDIYAATYHGHKVTISGSFVKRATTGGLAAASVKIGDSITFALDESTSIVGYLDSYGDELKQGATTTHSFEATFYPAMSSTAG
ncbi:MAG: hypothetical protein WC426_14260 [Sulfuriferula sp.]